MSKIPMKEEHEFLTLTEWERSVVFYAAGGGDDLPDTDRLWDTVQDLEKRGMMVGVKRGLATHMVPTPEALAAAIDGREQNGAET